MSNFITIEDSDDDFPSNSVSPKPDTPQDFNAKLNTKMDLLQEVIHLTNANDTNIVTNASEFKCFKQDDAAAVYQIDLKEEIIEIEDHDVKQEIISPRTVLNAPSSACSGNITVVNNTPGGVIIMNNGNNQELLLRNSRGSYTNVQTSIAPTTSTQTSSNSRENEPLLMKMRDGTLALAYPNKHYHCQICKFDTDELVALQKHVSVKHYEEVTKTEKKVTHLNGKCPICYKSYPNLKCLKNHVLDRHYNEPKDLFGLIWTTLGEVAAKDNVLSYSCPYCDLFGDSPSELRQHCASHSEFQDEIGELKCLFCYFKTMSYIDLASHVKTHYVDDVYFCFYCEFQTKIGNELTQHLSQSHPNPGKTLLKPNKEPRSEKLKKDVAIAGSSGGVNTVSSEFSEHDILTKVPNIVLQKYKNSKNEEVKMDELVCHYCSLTSKNLKILNEHMEDRHLHLDFLCMFCKCQCKTYNRLEEHESKNHPECFSCPFCMFKAFTRHEYRAHLNVHYRNGYFYCIYCDFSTVWSQYDTSRAHVLNEHLTRRVRFPNNDFWLFVHVKAERGDTDTIFTFKMCCNFCSFSTRLTSSKGVQSDMQLHLLKHIKPDRSSGSITCADCDYSIDVNVLMRNHLDEAHPEATRECLRNKQWLRKWLLSGMLTCPFCGYVCSIYRLWICHVNTKHPSKALTQWTLCFICKVTLFRSNEQMARHFHTYHARYISTFLERARLLYCCQLCPTKAEFYWDYVFCGLTVCQHIAERLKDKSDPHFAREFILMKDFKYKRLVPGVTGKLPPDCFYFINIVATKNHYVEHIESYAFDTSRNALHALQNLDKIASNANDLSNASPSTVGNERNMESDPGNEDMLHLCPHCRHLFSSIMKVAHHVRTEHNILKLYHCTFCTYTNKLYYMVFDHENYHKGFPKCKYCFYKCDKYFENGINRHMCHSHEKDLNCLRCVYCSFEVSLLNRKELRQHFIDKHYRACGNLFEENVHMKYIRRRDKKCIFCEFEVNDESVFKIHLSMHFPQNNEVIHCVYCTKFTTDLKGLMRNHLHKTHGLFEAERAGVIDYYDSKSIAKCSFCGFMSLSANVSNHEWKHHRKEQVVDWKISQIEADLDGDHPVSITLNDNQQDATLPVISHFFSPKEVNVDAISLVDTSNASKLLSSNEAALGFKIKSVESVVDSANNTSAKMSSRKKTIMSDWEDNIDVTVINVDDSAETVDAVPNKRKPPEDTTKEIMIRTYSVNKKPKISSPPPLVEFGKDILFENKTSEESDNVNDDIEDWNLVVMDGNDSDTEIIDLTEKEEDSIILNSTDF